MTNSFLLKSLQRTMMLSCTAWMLAAPLCASAAGGNVAATNDDDSMIAQSKLQLQGDRLTPELLWEMGQVGSVAVSPGGKHIAYTVTYTSVEKNKRHTMIKVMNADGTNPRMLTTTADNESEPAFTPDGKSLTFLSNKGGKNQVWCMNLDGSNRQQLTHEEKDVEGYKFSPCGKRVILVMSVPHNESIAAKEDDLPLASGMVINDMNFKHWDQYITNIPHIYWGELVNGRINVKKDILEGEPYECPVLPFGGSESYAWSPDGNQIVYSSRKKKGLDYALSTDTDIYLYDLASGETKNLCKPAGYVEPKIDSTLSMEHQAVNKSTADANVGYDTAPMFSPDGKYVAWLSMERNGYESDHNRICVLHLQSGEKNYITRGFNSTVDGMMWAPDSKSIYFAAVWQARVMLYTANMKGQLRVLTDGDYDYSAPLGIVGKNLIVKRCSMSAPQDIYALLTKGKGYAKAVQLTHENESFLHNITMGEVKERRVTTSDGKKELCWVIYPPHFDPNKKYPALLYCQGGPQSPVSQFWSVRWNFQMMAANDYVIIAPNRRGLPGFGAEWLEDISGDYSGQCMRDYLSAIDDLCKEPYIDKNRLGCVGASFGGYSVYYLAGNHDKRFKCFIAHDGIFNTEQQYYETEEMWFPNWDLGGAPWRDEMQQGTNAYTTSPHRYVDKWDTPILCIHGEKDYRILSSQGQAAFSAAIMKGIPAQLLLYPDENHWVLKPQNGVLWQRTFFRWLDKWLK